MIKPRKAKTKDAMYIQALLKKYSVEGDLLIRSLEDIYRNIRDFYVLSDSRGVHGVVALHVYWEDLAEVRSFVVDKKYRGKGLGEKLVEMTLKEAKHLGVKKVFALTKIPEYFKKKGFKNTLRKHLPQKIWKDCLACPKFKNCDETAVIKKI